MKGQNTKNVVLIADDDMFIRQVIRGAIGDLAIVVETKEGVEVPELYRKHTPDVVFLDVHMPGVSGLDLIKNLQKIDVGAHIIMMSSDSSTENVRYAKFNGVRGFLTKPFEKSRVLHYFNACPTIKFMDAE